MLVSPFGYIAQSLLWFSGNLCGHAIQLSEWPGNMQTLCHQMLIGYAKEDGERITGSAGEKCSLALRSRIARA